MIKTYNNLKIQFPLDECNKLYLKNLNDLIESSLFSSNRIAAFRFDLRFPLGHIDQSDRVITKFFESLKAQLKAKDVKTKKEMKRVYPHNLRYSWVRERDTSGNDHFHCVIIVNKDAYSVLGGFNQEEGNMAARIKRAWCSALGSPGVIIDGLVHFPDNGTYYVDNNAKDKSIRQADLFYRLSYFAKNATKVYGSGKRSFGCSRS